MESDQDKKQIKQPYEQPRLRIIELVAEEVLGYGCKLAGGRDWPGLPDCGIGNNCTLVGS